jgi:hypothetical protein
MMFGLVGAAIGVLGQGVRVMQQIGAKAVETTLILE